MVRRGLFFGGTTAIEPSGRDDFIIDGPAPSLQNGEDSDADEDMLYENPHTGETYPIPADQAKKARVPGGRAAVQKRIVADYDSDDGRIVQLKQQGYTDEYVSKRLVQEGRIRYVAKTVGSRWLRLRKALEQAEDAKLDDELSDWHVGEDEELHASFNIIDNKLEKEMQKLIDRKWKEISDHLASRLHKKKYTAKACRERYDGLKNGTALKAIELDSDQEGRKQMRETRITEAKRHRAQLAAEAQRLEEEKRRRAEENKAAKDDLKRVSILKAREKEQKRLAAERLNEERRMEKARATQAKRDAQAKAVATSTWARTARETEQALYHKMTGKRLGGGRGTRKRRRSELSSDDEEAFTSTDEDDESEMADDEDESDPEMDAKVDSAGRDISKRLAAAKRAKRDGMIANAKVTKETLLNPRSILTIEELGALLHERGLPRRAAQETHAEIVARLAAADEASLSKELNNPLRKHFDKCKGNKESKIKRLQALDARASRAGEQGVKSTDLEFKQSYEGYAGEYAALLDDDE